MNVLSRLGKPAEAPRTLHVRFTSATTAANRSANVTGVSSHGRGSAFAVLIKRARTHAVTVSCGKTSAISYYESLVP